MANNQIALMAQTPVFDTPYESQGKALQLRSLMNQGQVQDMDMQQRRQAIADDQQTRDVYRNVSDPSEQIKALYKINPKAARDMQTFQQGADKSAADIGKIKADTQKTQSEVINQKMTRGKDMLNTVNDPQSAARWVQGMFSDPDMAKVFAQGGDTVEQAIKRIPPDPKGFADWKQQSQLGAEKLISMTTPDANARLSAQTSLTTNANTNDTARRGQNMTAGTAAAGRAQSERHFGVTQSAGKVPAGYRANADGSMSFIPGGPADPAAGGGKAPTEFQGKSASFGARAEESDRILTALEKGGVKNTGIIKSTLMGAGEMVPFMGDKVGAAIGSGMNALPGFMGGPNGEQQQVEQARRDFVNAVLRQESGAAIGPSEFENAARQYFPQPGDKDSVVAQKAKNRKLAIQGFMNSAGKAAFHAQQDAPETPALPSGWTVKAN